MLFSLISPALWARHRNPVEVLMHVELHHWETLQVSTAFQAAYDTAVQALGRYLGRPENWWFMQRFPEHRGGPIAYLSTEFGLHESLGIYSGGLGVLSGDHCKAASDLGLPFVGVGLLNRGAISARRSTPRAGSSISTRTSTPPGCRFVRCLPVRASAHRPRPAPRPRGPPAGLQGPGGPHPGASARLRPAAERAPRPPDHAHSLRPRARDAFLPGAGPWRGAVRALRALGIHQRRGTSTKATPH